MLRDLNNVLHFLELLEGLLRQEAARKAPQQQAGSSTEAGPEPVAAQGQAAVIASQFLVTRPEYQQYQLAAAAAGQQASQAGAASSSNSSGGGRSPGSALASSSSAAAGCSSSSGAAVKAAPQYGSVVQAFTARPLCHIREVDAAEQQHGHTSLHVIEDRPPGELAYVHILKDYDGSTPVPITNVAVDNGCNRMMITQRFCEEAGIDYTRLPSPRVVHSDGVSRETIIGSTKPITIVLGEHSPAPMRLHMPQGAAVVGGDAAGMYNLCLDTESVKHWFAHVNPLYRALIWYPGAPEDLSVFNGVPVRTTYPRNVFLASLQAASGVMAQLQEGTAAGTAAGAHIAAATQVCPDAGSSGASQASACTGSGAGSTGAGAADDRDGYAGAATAGSSTGSTGGGAAAGGTVSTAASTDCSSTGGSSVGSTGSGNSTAGNCGSRAAGDSSSSASQAPEPAAAGSASSEMAIPAPIRAAAARPVAGAGKLAFCSAAFALLLCLLAGLAYYFVDLPLGGIPGAVLRWVVSQANRPTTIISQATPGAVPPPPPDETVVTLPARKRRSSKYWQARRQAKQWQQLEQYRAAVTEATQQRVQRCITPMLARTLLLGLLLWCSCTTAEAMHQSAWHAAASTLSSSLQRLHMCVGATPQEAMAQQALQLLGYELGTLRPSCFRHPI